jgi:hypothetical protein
VLSILCSKCLHTVYPRVSAEAETCKGALKAQTRQGAQDNMSGTNSDVMQISAGESMDEPRIDVIEIITVETIWKGLGGGHYSTH